MFVHAEDERWVPATRQLSSHFGLRQPNVSTIVWPTECEAVAFDRHRHRPYSCSPSVCHLALISGHRSRLWRDLLTCRISGPTGRRQAHLASVCPWVHSLSDVCAFSNRLFTVHSLQSHNHTHNLKHNLNHNQLEMQWHRKPPTVFLAHKFEKPQQLLCSAPLATYQNRTNQINNAILYDIVWYGESVQPGFGYWYLKTINATFNRSLQLDKVTPPPSEFN